MFKKFVFASFLLLSIVAIGGNSDLSQIANGDEPIHPTHIVKFNFN